MSAKYIKTRNNCIIVFSEALQHDQFKHFDPVSAGFIDIDVSVLDYNDYEVECTCYGESVSLDLKSDSVDSSIANAQILGRF